MDDRPNVVLLTADALRADHLSCYGYSRETSPVLDELAAESLCFENAYSASSHTREAVPALLAGTYPDTAVDAGYRLGTETIAGVLADEGYATAGIHSNPFVSRAYGFERGFDHFDDDLHFGEHKLIALAQRALDKLRNRHYARADEINERSLSWLDEVGDGPFFVWNHYMDTHGPYEPPTEYRRLFDQESVSDREAQSLYQRAVKNPDSITEAERERLIDLYDAEIRYNDAGIGAFLDSLDTRGLLEESLVIVTADHGDAFGEHGYFEHPRYLHEEITHVPLFVRPPGGTDGECIETPANTIDVAATIAEVIGDGDEWPGESLFDLPSGRVVFGQARGEDDDSHLRRYVARDRESAAFCEHDRESGDVEFTDVGDPTLREELRTHVEWRLGEGEETDVEVEVDVDDEISRRLSALGYRE